MTTPQKRNTLPLTDLDMTTGTPELQQQKASQALVFRSAPASGLPAVFLTREA